jgi:phenylalanyl-tRNA synthetase beta chain
LADRLTYGGLEVNAIERIGENWSREFIFVAQVAQVRQHPDADRLVLVTLDYGRDKPLEVVTGAPNLHVGDKGQKWCSPQWAPGSLIPTPKHAI